MLSYVQQSNIATTVKKNLKIINASNCITVRNETLNS